MNPLESQLSTIIGAIFDDELFIQKLMRGMEWGRDTAVRYLALEPRITAPGTVDLAADDFDFVYHLFLGDVARKGYINSIGAMANAGINQDLLRRMFRIGVHDGEFAL